MKIKITLLLFLFTVFFVKAQTANSLVDLETPNLDETSGLLFYNNSLITFNDSGGEPELYEIDINTGDITRTVKISNATNVDWEDIAQDDDYIYIGDFGNNYGNRTDLKIYKVSKTDYDDPSNNAVAEKIKFSYSNQINFAPNTSTNFDAEGLITYDNQLLIFSKNWGNNEVDVYAIPKTAGTHNASLVSNYNTDGMITGADISSDENTIFLTGYSYSEGPFMFVVQNIPNHSLDIFTAETIYKLTEICPMGNIIEAVALYETTDSEYHLYLTNEKFIAVAGPISIPFPAKLWVIEIEDETLNMNNNDLDVDVLVFPNPFHNKLTLSQIVDKISIYDISGKLITKHFNVNEITLQYLNSGVYFLHLNTNSKSSIKKIIKK